ncbi:MAG: 1-acyl-sn-glycerol-3-phosphate acyltransferase [Bacteroidales bacterium]|nr:1-acyl-sn-glycerol-3-phosphate acyltransferase [Bacteroidales bacterium]
MKRIWIALVKLCGWRFRLPDTASRPEVMRCVYAAAPHTAVSDFLIGIAYMWTVGAPGHIFIKKEFFHGPLGRLLRRYNCVAIDRGNPKNGIVEKAVQGFSENSDYAVILTPEATRKPVRRWKRGFWEIARRAGVPIVPVYIDFQHKEIGLFDTLWPTDDYTSDVQRLRSLYHKEMAKRPAQFIEAE